MTVYNEVQLRENLQAMKKVSKAYNTVAGQLVALDKHLMDLQHQARLEKQRRDQDRKAVDRYWTQTAVPLTKAG